MGRAAIAEMKRNGHDRRLLALHQADPRWSPAVLSHQARRPHAREMPKHSPPQHRNKDDEELRAIAATGGRDRGYDDHGGCWDTDNDGTAGMDDMIAHIEYIAENSGAFDHVGILLRFGTSMDGLRSRAHYADDGPWPPPEPLGAAHRPSARRGWTEEDLAKLLGR